ncbi:hypothetical protein ACHAXT_011895 [Thalassiosira profunda]
MDQPQPSTAVGQQGMGPARPTRTARIAALAVVCGALLPSLGSAFAPPSHRRATLMQTTPPVHERMARVATSAASTRLGYKHLGEEDEDPTRAELEGRNETALEGDASSSINVSVDVNVEVTRDVIYYNDLEPAAESNSYNSSLTGSSSGGGDGADGLIHELKDAIKQKNINTNDDTPKAIEPSKSKPAKKFVSPIQMIKKVPKVTPVHMSTVFFLKLIGDPQWPGKGRLSAGFVSPPVLRRPPGQDPTLPKKPEETKEKPETKIEATKPAVENWQTGKQGKKKSTAFMATSYLEALNTKAGTDSNEDKPPEDDMLNALKHQQAQLRKDKLQAQKEAIYEATRRTNPKEAFEKRIEEGEQERKKKEREKLERLYVERKERIDAKRRNEQRYLEERARQKEVLEQKARERGEAGGDGTADTDEDTPLTQEELTNTRSVKRGIPILDRPSFLDSPPLLVGSTLTYRYSELTLFQRRAVEVAQSHHKVHVARMKSEKEEGTSDRLGHLVEMLDDGTIFQRSQAGEEGGIEAAPILAVVDGYTADDTEFASLLNQQPSSAPGLPKPKRYATLASVEVVYDSNSEKPSLVKLTGVGRVFLRDYFSSREVGMTEEEEELSKLLARIQEMDGQVFEEEDSSAEDEDEDDEDGELPALMAEFDLLLDDSSILAEDSSTKYGQDVTKSRASSMHAITELYRSANKVYRLHEERKRIVAGLRAGMARLRVGKERANAECKIDFEDCDGLGLIGGAIDAAANEGKAEEATESSTENEAPRSRLETLDNYGLGSYGVLSTVPDLATQLMSTLEPYYSPAHREREEWEAEVGSMVAFRSLEEYATSREVAEALLMPSATQRMELAYAIMLRHRDDLEALAEMISDELVDCGEECSDLW